jgi:hypothetical protein
MRRLDNPPNNGRMAIAKVGCGVGARCYVKLKCNLVGNSIGGT